VIGRPARFRLLALLAGAAALAGAGLAVEKADLFPELRFAVQQTSTALPSTAAVGPDVVARGLPVLSVYLDPADLRELLANKFEHGRQWERKATVSYFSGGELKFAGAAGIRVHGGGSRYNSPKQSFRLFFRRSYGFTRLGTNVLFGEPSQPLQRLVVHNDVRRDSDGTNWWLVNPLAYDLSRRIGCITPETQPARFILNGEDYGLFVLTEHFDDEYFSSHLPGRPITMDGADMERFRDRLDAIRPLTMSAVDEVLDLDNLTSWFLSVVFSGTRDAYQGPGQFFDESTRRWFWVNWDMDTSFRNWDLDSFYYLLPFPGERYRGRRRSEPRPIVIGTLIAEDSAYRAYLAGRIDTMLNHQLTPEFLRERRDYYARVRTSFGVADRRYQRRLDEFLERRPAFVRAIAEQWLNTPPSVPVTVERPGGTLRVDGFEVPGRYRGAYFPGRDVLVETADRRSVRWLVNGTLRSEGPDLRLRAEQPMTVAALDAGVAATAVSPEAPRPASTPPDAGASAPRAVRWVRVPGLPRGGSFEMIETETTVDQYRAYAAATRQRAPRQPMWSAGDHPVVNLTWEDAAGYCEWIGGRLSTEAEWEFAARAAANTRYPWGDDFDPNRANGARTAGRDRWPYTAPVASFPPNPFGLYDMIGNVWEWTSDWVQRGAPPPAGPQSATFRKAVRGGSWINNPDSLRVDRRLGLSPAGRHNFYIGFRCAR
jgi:formylglycine-generating enzyme required for sulfatase activity